MSLTSTKSQNSSKSSIKSDSNRPWKLAEGSQLSQASLHGEDYAETIRSLALGGSKSEPSLQQNFEYPSFKKVFFMEPRYNPALDNTHMSYEMDAQIKEQEAAWAKGGKVFSGEPRFPKWYVQPTPGGFLKVEEIPKVSEKPVLYYPRNGEVRPFQRVFKHKGKATRKVKLSYEEETAHLGPGSYETIDPWVDNLKPVCGRIQPTAPFAPLYHSLPNPSSEIMEGQGIPLDGGSSRSTAKLSKIRPLFPSQSVNLGSESQPSLVSQHLGSPSQRASITPKAKVVNQHFELTTNYSTYFHPVLKD